MSEPSDEVLACVNGHDRRAYLAKKQRAEKQARRAEQAMREKRSWRVEEVARLRAAGFTYREIGEGLGVTTQRAHQILSAHMKARKSDDQQ